jgi:hypothetical protein
MTDRAIAVGISGVIHQSALDEKPWITFLRHLCAHLECDCSALSIGNDRPEAIFMACGDRECASWMREIIVQSWRPVIAERAIQNRPASWMARILHKEGGIPCRQLSMVVLHQGGWTCHIDLLSADNGRDFDAFHEDYLIACRPHLASALHLAARRHDSGFQHDRYRLAVEIIAHTMR